MKHAILKKMAMIVLSLGTITAAPALAEDCPLCPSARDGDLAEFNALLDNRPEGTFVNATRANGQFALLLAVRYEHAEIVDLLINDPTEPANVNLANQHDRTALMWAAQNGNLQIAELLVPKVQGINDKGGQQDKSALLYALTHDNRPVAELLVMHGAVLDCPDGEEFNPQTIACEMDAPECPYFEIAHSGECISPPHNKCIFTGGVWTDNDEFSSENWNGSFDGADEFCDCGDEMRYDGENGCVPLPACEINEVRADDGISCDCVDGHDRVANPPECRPIPPCDAETQMRNGDDCDCNAANGFVDNGEGGCENPADQCEAEDGHWIPKRTECVFPETEQFLYDALWPIEPDALADPLLEAFLDSGGEFSDIWPSGGNYSPQFFLAISGELVGYQDPIGSFYFDRIKWLMADYGAEFDCPSASGPGACPIWSAAIGVVNASDRQNAETYLQYAFDEHRHLDPNAHGGYSFRIFVRYNSLAAVNIMLDWGVNCNLQSENGSTAFSIAEQEGHTAILQALNDRCDPPETQAATAENCDTTLSLELGADPSEAVETVECETAELEEYVPETEPEPDLPAGIRDLLR